MAGGGGEGSTLDILIYFAIEGSQKERRLATSIILDSLADTEFGKSTNIDQAYIYGEVAYETKEE